MPFPTYFIYPPRTISAWLSITQSAGLSLNLCPTKFLIFIFFILSVALFFVRVPAHACIKKVLSIMSLYLGRIKSALPPKFRLASALIVSYHSHVSDNGDLRQKFLIESVFASAAPRLVPHLKFQKPRTNRLFSDGFKCVLFLFLAFKPFKHRFFEKSRNNPDKLSTCKYLDESKGFLLYNWNVSLCR